MMQTIQKENKNPAHLYSTEKYGDYRKPPEELIPPTTTGRSKRKKAHPIGQLTRIGTSHASMEKSVDPPLEKTDTKMTFLDRP